MTDLERAGEYNDIGQKEQDLGRGITQGIERHQQQRCKCRVSKKVRLGDMHLQPVEVAKGRGPVNVEIAVLQKIAIKKHCDHKCHNAQE